MSKKYAVQRFGAGNAVIDCDIPEAELLVFGYQCKLFRDDEKATYVEEEKHLIPWMGNASLMIDRYDGRGHLHDLDQYDAEANARDSEDIDEDEKRIEAICDEERYLELHVDLAEKAIYEEEELKRLHQELAAEETAPYQAVGFSYEQYDPAEPTQETGLPQTAGDEEEDDPDDGNGHFLPAPELQLPPHMEHPGSIKLNAVIEKTAEFVSKHGGQMEIMIKTKQSANQQFGFLTFEHPLNPYYKHMVVMIKRGKYIPGVHKPQMVTRNATSSSDSESDQEDGYLHPSLMASSSTQNLPKLPTLTTSQIENTAYGMLIKRMGIITGAASPTANSQDQSAKCNDRDEKDAQHQPCHAENSVPYDIPPPPGTEEVQLPERSSKPSDSDLLFVEASDTPSSSPRYTPSSSPSKNFSATPPPDVKIIIDRMASYVVKDGIEFENQVRAQGDLRFEFLNSSHPHHAYYKKLKAQISSDERDKAPSSKAVSFSIKFKEQDAALLEKKAALMLNDSSDDECGRKDGATDNQTAQPEQPTSVDLEDTQKKLSEQRLKDKLAAAAREKLAQTSKESKHKLLQEERKKRAAMFVTMLKHVSKDPSPKGPDLPAVANKEAHKDSNSRDRGKAQPFNSSRSRSPKRSRSRSSPQGRHGSKSRSPNRKHSKSSVHGRGSYAHVRSTSPSATTKHKRKHSRKSSRSHRVSPTPPVSNAKQALRADTTERVSSSKQNDEPEVDIRILHNHSKPASVAPEDAPSRNSPFMDHINDAQDDMILKVRKMLQASRKAIFKEDMIGD